ncbi:hypothetical protein NN561_005742 [Cricetulus griseus]
MGVGGTRPLSPQRSRLKVKSVSAGGGERGGDSPGPFVRRPPRALALRLLRPVGSGGGECRSPAGSEGGSGHAPVTRSRLSPPGKEGVLVAVGERWDPGVRDPREGRREGGIKRRRRRRVARSGERLASNPGVRVPSPRAQRAASAQRRAATSQKGGNSGRGRRSRNRLPRHGSSKGWEALAFDGYGRGEGGWPRSEPTQTSGLGGLGNPGAKRGGGKDSNGDAPSSHSAAAGLREKDPTRGRCSGEGNGR